MLTMFKKNLFGVIYVSTWVIIWGTIGSIVDRPLLDKNIYVEGSIGQIATFAISALIVFIIARVLFPKLLNNSFVIAALGLDAE